MTQGIEPKTAGHQKEQRAVHNSDFDTHEFIGHYEHETREAVLVWIDDNDIWIPKSQLQQGTSPGLEDYESGYENGDMITICIYEWLAVEKRLL